MCNGIVLSRIRIIEKNQLATKTAKVHHLKIKGHQQHIAKFLNVLRSIDFGGHPTVFQQYSPDHAAVNIESEGPIDLMKLSEVAKENEVDLEWVAM